MNSWAPYFPLGYGWPTGYPGQLVFGQEQHMLPGTFPGTSMIEDDPNVKISNATLMKLLKLVASARGVRPTLSVGCPPSIGGCGPSFGGCFPSFGRSTGSARASGGGGGGRPFQGFAPSMVRATYARAAAAQPMAHGGGFTSRVPTPATDDSGRPYMPPQGQAAPGFQASWNGIPSTPGQPGQAAPGFQASWNGVPMTPGQPGRTGGGVFPPGRAGGGTLPPTTHFSHPYVGPGGTQHPFLPTRPASPSSPSSPMHPAHAPRIHPHMLRRWSQAWTGEPFFYYGCWWVLTPQGWVCYLDYPHFF